MTARARQLSAEGHDVISFAAGEPDFGTPEPICEAAIEAIRHGETKYTAGSGTPALKAAIVTKLAKDNSLDFTPKQIVVSCGAKHSLYNAFQVLVDPGDEVIIFSPYWMTYADQVILAGGTPVFVQTTLEQGFVPDLADLSAAITDRTKAIVVNSPANPTGAVFPEDILRGIARIAFEKGLWVISDEIYEHLSYAAPSRSIATLVPEILPQAIIVNGCSKSFAMTGWRIGYAAAPIEVANAMSCLQDQVTSNPTSFAQRGAVTALGLPSNVVIAMRDTFNARRQVILECLNKLKGVRCPEPKGAFYALADFSEHLCDRFSTDVELADFLLSESYVATVPGSVFGAPGFLRFSYATSPEQIREGVGRIARALRI